MAPPGFESTCSRRARKRNCGSCSDATSTRGSKRIAGLPGLEAAKLELARSASLQSDIWAAAVAGSRSSDTPAASMLLLPALNQMIDITTTRTMVAEIHPPPVMFVMPGAVALISALVAGYGMAGKTRSGIHTVAFASVVGATVYVIFDIEYPRLGLIRVDAIDHVLVDLRGCMK